MTTEQAAAICKVKRGTIIQWIRREKLKAEKRGRDWHITPGALRSVVVKKAGRRKEGGKTT